jgi:hypothetical protein
VTGGSTFVIGTNPGFSDLPQQDFHLTAASQAIDAGVSLDPNSLPQNNVVRQYVKHQASGPRPVSEAFDIGAFEYSALAPMQLLTNSLPDGIRFRYYFQNMTAAGGSGSYLWSISTGLLPPGLVLDAATGVLRGHARARGSWNFTVVVADAQNPATSASRSFTINTRLHL